MGINDDLIKLATQLYQVVGVLADELGEFDDTNVIKVMDYLNLIGREGRLPNYDIIPFYLERDNY